MMKDFLLGFSKLFKPNLISWTVIGGHYRVAGWDLIGITLNWLLISDCCYWQVVGDEYRGLLEQLATMRSLCDKLKQNNLRRDLDQLQASLYKHERATAGE